MTFVDVSKIAYKVLVIMAVGMMARWKAPISFHMTKGCTAEAQSQLLLLRSGMFKIGGGHFK